MNQQTEPELLTGWKAIAAFCGVKDVRTVQGWHREYNMPIVKYGRTVTAFKYALRQWFVEMEKKIHE